MVDIEKELRHYTKHFKNKKVICNCDDPRVSNFFHYFSYNFEKLQLKKLTSICYKNNQVDLFSENKKEKAIYLEYFGDKNNNKVPDIEEIGINQLIGDGDFRSEESIKLLQDADIVVTNPPFSLFREYMDQLIKFKKKFLVIGNMNALTYKEIFPLFKDNKVWFGPSIKSGDREFGIPRDMETRTPSLRIDDKGNKFIRVKGVRWFTNLEFKTRKTDLVLYKKYTPEEYPKYDNYDAIDIGKTSEIPIDYEGPMGAPITFMDKYNPDQFEILGNLGSYAPDGYSLASK
ncbi:MAG: adenine-specific methyltransferase EcoRI family protein, partial [Burkholderiaceae bacterium]